jgi:hypothetical protein
VGHGHRRGEGRQRYRPGDWHLLARRNWLRGTRSIALALPQSPKVARPRRRSQLRRCDHRERFGAGARAVLDYVLSIAIGLAKGSISVIGSPNAILG